MAEYKPRDDYTFRAHQWWGDIHQLPRDWWDRIVVTDDGTLVIPGTHNGPVAVKPDGTSYIREHPERVNDRELWPVKSHVFEATYRVVQ